MPPNKDISFTCMPNRPDPDNGTFRLHAGFTDTPTSIIATLTDLPIGPGPFSATVSLFEGEYVRFSYTNEDGEIYYSNTLGPFVYDA